MTGTGPRAPNRDAADPVRLRAWLRPTATEAAVLGVIAAAGAVHLAFAFSGDQALFTTAAEGMRHGDRLYVDFWDYKQPGIFLWYLVAGLLFGYRETGIHLAEILYLLAFSRFLQLALRPRFEHAVVAAAVPLFTVGAYYAAATSWELTQVEGLVAFPLALCAWSAFAATDRPAGRHRLLLLSGLAAAAVTYLKLMYLPLTIGFWAIALAPLRREGSDALRRAALQLAGGLAVPWLVLLAYFAWQGIVGDMWWAFVQYPFEVRSLDPRPSSRLTEALSHTARFYAWLAPLAVAGAWSRGRNRWGAALGCWLLLGFGLVLLQNWWNYHFVLLVWPVGILAALGVDALWTGRRFGPVAVGVVLVTVALALRPAREIVHKVRVLAADDLALTAEGRRAFTDEWHPDYAQARQITAFLRQPGAAPGPIHVVGDPVILYLSGREEAMPLNGWAAEQANERLWRRTRDELVEYRPAYLFVDDYSMGFVRERSPETLELLEREFCALPRTADGRWYAPRGTSPCEGSS